MLLCYKVMAWAGWEWDYVLGIGWIEDLIAISLVLPILYRYYRAVAVGCFLALRLALRGVHKRFPEQKLIFWGTREQSPGLVHFHPLSPRKCRWWWVSGFILRISLLLLEIRNEKLGPFKCGQFILILKCWNNLQRYNFSGLEKDIKWSKLVQFLIGFLDFCIK